MNYDKMNYIRKKATNFFELRKLMKEIFDLQHKKISKQRINLAADY